VFYSQLDELLFEEQQKLERNTVKGQLKLILAADDKSQAFKDYLKSILRETPLKTKITLWTILAFLFVLVFGV
jgi:predicted nucleotidyltransferase